MALAESLRAPKTSPAAQSPGVLPGNPWARRLMVALDAHVGRQRWVAKVMRDALHTDPLAIGAGGAFEHPSPATGEVPGMPEWRYEFHGIGCRLTHQDGTAIDVDFDEHGADGIDPWFFGEYLRSLPRPRGIEAMLRRSKPLDEWWMPELDVLRGLEWIEGDHRVRVTPLGARWASALRPAFEAIAAGPDPAEQLRAALLIEDFPWAAQLKEGRVPSELQQRAIECTEIRASQLEEVLRTSGSRWALSCMAVLDGHRAARCAEEVLRRSPLDALTALALDFLVVREPGPGTELLLALARRATAPNPPAPYLRTRAVTCVLKRYRADSITEALRAQILEAILPDTHSCEGIAAVLHSLVDPEPGLARLGRCLGSAVPLARADAAAALALLGTPEAAAVLRDWGNAPEARAALALLRGVRPEPGPKPEGSLIEWHGRE